MIIFFKKILFIKWRWKNNKQKSSKAMSFVQTSNQNLRCACSDWKNKIERKKRDGHYRLERAPLIKMALEVLVFGFYFVSHYIKNILKKSSNLRAKTFVNLMLTVQVNLSFFICTGNLFNAKLFFYSLFIPK